MGSSGLGFTVPCVKQRDWQRARRNCGIGQGRAAQQPQGGLAVGAVEIYRHAVFHPFGECQHIVQAHHALPQAAVFHHAILLEIAAAHQKAGLLRAARHRRVVVGNQPTLGHFLLPAGVHRVGIESILQVDFVGGGHRQPVVVVSLGHLYGVLRGIGHVQLVAQFLVPVYLFGLNYAWPTLPFLVVTNTTPLAPRES